MEVLSKVPAKVRKMAHSWTCSSESFQRIKRVESHIIVRNYFPPNIRNEVRISSLSLLALLNISELRVVALVPATISALHTLERKKE